MKNYKIAFILSTGYWWDQRYLYKEIEALSGKGIQVDFLVNSEDQSDYKGVKFVKLGSKQRKNARLTGGVNLLKKIIDSKYDAIQILNVELMPLGLLTKLLTKIKVFYDCKEDHISSIRYHKPNLPKFLSFTLSLFVKYMDFIADKVFDGIITSDDSINNDRKAKKENKFLFYNMALKSHFPDYTEIMRRKYDLCIMGSMSVRTGALDIIKAVISIKNEKSIIYKVKILGDPTKDIAMWNEMKPLLDALGKDNYFITGTYPYYQVKELISDIKIGLIPLLDMIKFRKNIAMKQFEYIANGMPIISSDLPPQRIFLDESTTIFYEPGNVNQLAEKIDSLLKDKAKLQFMSNSARQLFESKLNAEEQMKGYSDFIFRRLRNE